MRSRRRRGCPRSGRVHAGVCGRAARRRAAVAWLLFRTPLGFRLRAVGLSPRRGALRRHLARAPRRRGARDRGAPSPALAGAFEVAGVTGRLFERLSPGYGYTAIAVALLARLHPLAVVPSALFFGALEAGAGAMQREAGVPSVATQVVQGS